MKTLFYITAYFSRTTSLGVDSRFEAEMVPDRI